ncbi:AAA family ATPase [Candidatus Saccharibacteria bacterium]|nr:MAG: AAA family ATPase [Candidatus Saccharibacteria bacterium]
MFDELLLGKDAKASLEAFLAKPAHAILLTGQRGTGLTSIANLLAKELLGSKNLENEQYFRLLASEKGTIPIESVRDLQGFFALTVPGNSAIKRVVVIDDADTLSTEAQNALLKTLEEPPQGSVLILATHDSKRLLATIRSRTTELAIPAPSKRQTADWFIVKGYAPADIERAYLMADGSLRQMQAILSGKSSTDTDTIRAVLAGTSYDRLLYVDGMAKDKAAANEFVDNLVRVATVSLERAANQNPTTMTRWQSVLRASTTAQDALEKNGNTKLVLTDLMLSL